MRTSPLQPIQDVVDRMGYALEDISWIATGAYYSRWEMTRALERINEIAQAALPPRGKDYVERADS